MPILSTVAAPALSTASQELRIHTHCKGRCSLCFSNDLHWLSWMKMTLVLLQLHLFVTPILHPSQLSWLAADGRLLQAHKRMQELSNARGIAYMNSDNHFPEIGPDLANLGALKDSIDKVTASAHRSFILSSIHASTFSLIPSLPPASLARSLPHLLAPSVTRSLTHLFQKLPTRYVHVQSAASMQIWSKLFWVYSTGQARQTRPCIQFAAQRVHGHIAQSFHRIWISRTQRTACCVYQIMAPRIVRLHWPWFQRCMQCSQAAPSFRVLHLCRPLMSACTQNWAI